jgi:hypothetical protein
MMFKRALTCFLALGLVLMGLCTAASAAQNVVANTSQKGSLLIFPKIDVTSGRDTIVKISNDYPRGVFVKCYWVDEDQTIQDFQFMLTITQPVWFRASDGLGTGSYTNHATTNPIITPRFSPEKVGELECWAVNAEGDQQISWNHLTGRALVLDYNKQTSYEYNAWAFSARDVILGKAVEPPGSLKLSGKNKQYDACPQYLVFDFFTYDPTANSTRFIDIAGGGAAVQVGQSDLSLVTCKQDLRRDRVPTCTKVKFDIWNENETKYTGAYQCLRCWFDSYLTDIGAASGQPGGHGGEKFSYPGLHTTAGRFRVQGVASSTCKGKYALCTQQVSTPFLGVMSTTFEFLTPSRRTEVTGGTAYGAGIGAADDVTILWDSAYLPDEAAGK